MDDLKRLVETLANESGGGDSLGTLEPQNIAAVALLLRDGRVAVWPVGAAISRPSESAEALMERADNIRPYRGGAADD